jgi:asparagine synthase (glutamine-hydrolysing)
MCGICGQLNLSNQAPVDSEDIVRMTRTMAHRGPDDEGYYISSCVGLGFRRLSIIDLQGGHQPMCDSSGSVWVVFNGEIYNFKELRNELEAADYEFRTDSDTEVLVHGYKHWGDDVLNHLNGMFGLAIWDARRGRLMLARDHMGIKPIYYALDSGRLLFGSEIRPILTALPGKPSIDPIAIRSFLQYRYTPSPFTILKGIKKLAAGTRLIVEPGYAPRLERWWNFTPQPFDPMPSDREAEEQLLAIYRKAVRRHLISDVPVGLLLSGGLDSALLLQLMRERGKTWDTYTVGYGSSFADDELIDAGRTARTLQSRNMSIEIDSSEFEASMACVISALEEPVATSSVIPMYHVCQQASLGVKVALIGQGPDELFGGYTRHIGVQYGRYWRAVPQPTRSALKHLFRLIPRNEWLRRALSSLDTPDRLHRYQQVFSIMSDCAIDGLFRQDVLPQIFDKTPEYWTEMASMMHDTDELGGLQFLEIRSSLPDELLVYADKLSMAHGLELRVPYLDREIVEYVERLSSSFKVRYGVGKWLHRRIARNFLPAEILRRKKRGFATNVVDNWLRASVSKQMNNLLNDEHSLIYNYLRFSAIRDLTLEHQSGRSDHHKILFSLIVLEHILRQYDARGPLPMDISISPALLVGGDGAIR